MNRKEATEILPVIQAYAEGKEIQLFVGGRWVDTKYITSNNSPQHYRIKPKSTYRPFANAEECWQEMQEHQPFGWLKTIGVRTHFAECKSIGELVMIGLENTPHIYEHAFHTYTFTDGTPFGVKVEE